MINRHASLKTCIIFCFFFGFLFKYRYCYECVNKATNERKCIVCGGHRPAPVGKMVYCELCPRAYHHDCYIPPLIKVPRGKWYCHGCASKAPPPKRRGPSKKATKDKDPKDKDSKDGKDPKDECKKSKEKKSSETHRENSNSNSATSETNSVDQSLNISNVPAVTSNTSKSNEISPSRYVIFKKFESFKRIVCDDKD